MIVTCPANFVRMSPQRRTTIRTPMNAPGIYQLLWRCASTRKQFGTQSTAAARADTRPQSPCKACLSLPHNAFPENAV